MHIFSLFVHFAGSIKKPHLCSYQHQIPNLSGHYLQNNDMYGLLASEKILLGNSLFRDCNDCLDITSISEDGKSLSIRVDKNRIKVRFLIYSSFIFMIKKTRAIH